MPTSCLHSEFAMPSQRSDRETRPVGLRTFISNGATGGPGGSGHRVGALEHCHRDCGCAGDALSVALESSPATHCSMFTGTRVHVRCGPVVPSTRHCVRTKSLVKQAAVPSLKSFGSKSDHRHARRPAISAMAAVKGVASFRRTIAGNANTLLTVSLVQVPQLQARLKRKQIKNAGRSPGEVSVLWINGNSSPRSCCSKYL